MVKRHVYKRTQQLPTTRNNMRQAVQTGATCNITKLIITIFGVKFDQQCCVRLHRALSYRVAFTEYKFP